MMTMLSNIVDILTIVVVLFPIGVQIFSLVAQKAHNQKLINLSERAKIVVNALEQSGLESTEKKHTAMKKLSAYASEVGIKVTEGQLSDYIESAVSSLKKLNQ